MVAASADESLTVEGLYREHVDFVYRVAGRLANRGVDREDVVQEVFMVVARRLDSYARTSLVTTWLYSITLNVARAMGRRVRREAARWANETAAYEIADAPVDIIEMRHAQRIAREILDAMAPKRREVFILAEFEELSCAEIAVIVGAKEETVWSRLFYARKEFARRLAKLQRAKEAETYRSERMANDSDRICTRRQFVVVGGGSALALLAMPGCDLPGARLAVGVVDATDQPGAGGGGGGGGGGVDAGGGAAGGASDLATPPTDAAASRDLTSPGGAACPAGAIGAGAASALAVGQAKHFSSGNNYDLYLCRDAGGLFSVDARCTHTGCTVQLSANAWACPCHGATFAFDGQNPTSPARSPLSNYAVCVDAAGDVTIDYKTIVGPATRV